MNDRKKKRKYIYSDIISSNKNNDLVRILIGKMEEKMATVD